MVSKAHNWNGLTLLLCICAMSPASVMTGCLIAGRLGFHTTLDLSLLVYTSSRLHFLPTPLLWLTGEQAFNYLDPWGTFTTQSVVCLRMSVDTGSFYCFPFKYFILKWREMVFQFPLSQACPHVITF